MREIRNAAYMEDLHHYSWEIKEVCCLFVVCVHKLNTMGLCPDYKAILIFVYLNCVHYKSVVYYQFKLL